MSRRRLPKHRSPARALVKRNAGDDQADEDEDQGDDDDDGAWGALVPVE